VTAPRRPTNGRYLSCRWSCVICDQDGTVRVWVLIGEPLDRAIRWHIAATRAKCLPTCAYTVDTPGLSLEPPA
jgi:hypothetical protein